MAAKKAHFEAKNEALAVAKAGHKDLRSALAKVHKARKDALWAGFKGASDLPARRSLLAAKLARERLDLRDRCRTEIAGARAKYPRFPNFKDWRQPGRGRPATPATMGVAGPETGLPVQKHDLRDFNGQAAGRVVHYVNSDGDRSFTDSGKTVTVIDTESPAAILAALQLCGAKFGEAKFDVTGSTDFKERVCRLAAQHGIRLKDPNLQSIVDKFSAEIKAAKAKEIANDRARNLADRAIREAQHRAQQAGAGIGAAGKRVGWSAASSGIGVDAARAASDSVQQAIDRLAARQAKELEDFKSGVDLVELAKTGGFVVVDLTGLGSRFVVLERDHDVIMISRDERGRDVFTDLESPDRPAGTVLDFVQAKNMAANLGEARKVLRPWLPVSTQPSSRLPLSSHAEREAVLRQLQNSLQAQEPAKVERSKEA